MLPDEYKCAMCKGVFKYGWSEEEARAEAEGSGFDVESCGIVCDDCYKQTPWGEPDPIEGDFILDISPPR